MNSTETSAMPEYIMSLDGGPLMAGVQNSVYVLLAIVLRIYFGPLADRKGAPFVMLIGACGFCVPTTVMPAVTSPWAAATLHIMQAVGLAAYHPCVSSLLATLAPPGKIGRNLGALRFVTTTAAMVGPVALFPIIESLGYPMFFACLACIGFAGMILTLAMQRQCENPSIRAEEDASASSKSCRPAVFGPFVGFWKSLSVSNALLLALPFLMGLGYSIVLNYSQMLAKETLGELNPGLVFSSFSAGGLAGSIIIGYAFDRFGAKKSVLAGTMCCGLGMLASSAPLSPPALLACQALAGIGYYGTMTGMSSAAGTDVGRAKLSRFYAAQQSGIDLGIVFGGLGISLAISLGMPLQFGYITMGVTLLAFIPLWVLCYKQAA